MTVNVAGIMGTVALCCLSYSLINTGGSALQESVAAVKQGQIITEKRRYIKKAEPTRFFITLLQEILWGLLQFAFAAGIIYAVFFSSFASALR